MSARAWIPAGVALLVFALLAIAASGPDVLPGDQRIADWILVSPESGADYIARGIAWTMRSRPVAAIALTCTVLVAVRGRWRVAIFLIAIVPAMHLSFPLKDLIASPRPNGVDGDWGFPAGRAGNAVFIAVALALVAPRLPSNWKWLTAGIWVAGVGWSRIATGDQWPSDVVGAWLWSAPVVVILARVLRVA